jgi:hypothetical protein
VSWRTKIPGNGENYQNPLESKCVRGNCRIFAGVKTGQIYGATDRSTGNTGRCTRCADLSISRNPDKTLECAGMRRRFTCSGQVNAPLITSHRSQIAMVELWLTGLKR